jgi:hypothetical protein
VQRRQRRPVLPHLLRPSTCHDMPTTRPLAPFSVATVFTGSGCFVLCEDVKASTGPVCRMSRRFVPWLSAASALTTRRRGPPRLHGRWTDATTAHSTTPQRRWSDFVSINVALVAATSEPIHASPPNYLPVTTPWLHLMPCLLSCMRSHRTAVLFY